MQVYELDHHDFEHGNAHKQDEQLAVRFLIKQKEDRTESQKAGRPIYKDVEYVEIRVPGRRDPQACRPATDFDKQRFSRHYELFQKRIEDPETGTPLSQWPRITRSMVEELKYFNVKTVEQLANLADNHAQKFHMGLNFKQEAQEWLKKANQTALIAEKQALTDQVTSLKAEMAELRKIVHQQAEQNAREPNQLDLDLPEPAPRTGRSRAKKE